MSTIINATTTNGVVIQPDNSGSLQLATNSGTTAVTIDTSQNVGIGVTPAYKLDIASTAQLRVASSAGNAAGFELCGNGTTYNSTSLFVGQGSTNIGYLYQRANEALVFGTNNIERMRIDSSGYAQGTVNGLSAGRMQAYQYYRLNSANAGANATGAQSVFGVGVTLVGSTQYEFEAVFTLTKSAGTTSHTTGIGFGGTATLNNIGYQVTSYLGSAQLTVGVNATQITTGYISSASNTTITVATAVAAATVNIIVKGTVSINAGGTFIPQYTLSAAPGGAYTTQIGSYFKISPLAASGANVNVGSWA